MEEHAQKTVLVIGYGNPGRRDDGLGPALAAHVEQAALEGVDVDIDYQLNIEHAYDLKAYDVVIFADATIESETSPYYFQSIEPGNPTSFSTHSVSPGAVLRLAKDLFQADTQAYVLGITGYEFEDIAEGLTPQASSNLTQAVTFLTDWLKHFRTNMTPS